jgi:hypothetical protein
MSTASGSILWWWAAEVVHTYERVGSVRYGAFSVDEHTSTERLFKGEFRMIAP